MHSGISRLSGTGAGDFHLIHHFSAPQKVAPRKVAQHDKDNIACTNLATTYHAALGDSSKDLLSSDSFAPTTIPSRSDGLRLGKNRSALVGGRPQIAPPFSPRRLRTSLPHHGERWEPGRAVRRGAAPSSFAPGAFSASRSEEPAGPPSSARLPTLFRSMGKKKVLRYPAQVAPCFVRRPLASECFNLGPK